MSDIFDRLIAEEEAHEAGCAQRREAQEARERAVAVARVRVASRRIAKPVMRGSFRPSEALKDKQQNVALLKAVAHKTAAETALLQELEREYDRMWDEEHKKSTAAFLKRHPNMELGSIGGKECAVDKHVALLARDRADRAKRHPKAR